MRSSVISVLCPAAAAVVVLVVMCSAVHVGASAVRSGHVHSWTDTRNTGVVFGEVGADDVFSGAESSASDVAQGLGLLDYADDFSRGGYWALSRQLGFLPLHKLPSYSNRFSSAVFAMMDRDYSLSAEDRTAFIGKVESFQFAEMSSEFLESLSEGEIEDCFNSLVVLIARYIRIKTMENPGLLSVKIPKSISYPLFYASKKLDRFPALGYAGIVLDNCEKMNDNSNTEWQPRWNVRRSLSDLAGERGFYVAHCEQEEVLAQAVYAGFQLMRCIQDESNCDPRHAHMLLYSIADGVRKGIVAMKHMSRYVMTSQFFGDVRPYMKYKLPEAEIVFEGAGDDGSDVSLYDIPGPTGAQSSSIPFVDAVLGIEVSDPQLFSILMKFRAFYPKLHRDLIEQADRMQSSIRSFVNTHWELRFAFDDAITAVAEWRAAHVVLTDDYIRKQIPGEATGTGNTPFHRYLCHHLYETISSRLNRSSSAVAVPELCLRISSSLQQPKELAPSSWDSISLFTRGVMMLWGIAN